MTDATLESRLLERTAQLETLIRTLWRDNARFELAADAAGLGFWSFNSGTKMIDWDDRMYRLYGLAGSTRSVPYAEWLDMVHAEDRERCRREIDESLKARNSFETEFRVTWPNGTVRHLRSVARATEGRVGESAQVFGVDIDVTERKRADEQFRLAIEAAPTGMLLMDAAGTIVMINAQVTKIFGYSRPELLGQSIEMLVPEQFRVHHPDLREAFFANPNVRTMGAGRDLYGLCKDGSEVPIEIGLNPLHTSEGEFVLSSILDITERRRATEHFRLALEAAPTGMLMLDHRGTIVLVNAQIESLFGYPRDELLGGTIEMLVPARFRRNHPAHREGFFAAPRMRAMGPDMELYGLRKDGTEIPVEIGLNPLHTAAGIFVISSIVDLTRQREIDQMRSEFVSTVSHELRTPLTSISGALGLLQSGAVGALPDKATTMARIAYRNSERLVRIINDILDIGKLDAGKLEFRYTTLNISELLHQSIEANAAFADKYGVRFQFDDDFAGEQTFADPNRLMQVLANLLSNAVKFSPRGASVHIRASRRGSMVRVEIEDSGAGIPEEFQSRIFQRFSQADASATPRFEGTGLGLSIARKLIEGMGGTIGFSTVVGQGTIFYFDLPIFDPAADTANSIEPVQATAACLVESDSQSISTNTPNTGIPRLLCVDDDGNLHTTLRTMMADHAVVVAARASEEAERLLREQPFQMVILDQCFLSAKGIRLMEQIPQLAGHLLPVVVFAEFPVSAELQRKVTYVFPKAQASAKKVATQILAFLDHP